MTVTLPLNEDMSVTLDGSGNGTVTMRPDGPHEVWLPDSASCKAPNPNGGTPNKEARFDLYIGWKVADQYFVDGTYSGSSGASTGRVSGYRVGRHADPAIIGVWQGGDPGATATLRIQGDKEIG